MPRILAVPASLRVASYNRRLLEAARPMAPAGLHLEVYPGLGDLPLFDEDREGAGAELDAVRRLADAVAAADGVLIATPEYNQSMPGVLKNALDWLSRPIAHDVLEGKPAAVIGATSGPWGTRLAQAELRHVLDVAGAVLLPRPRLYLRDAATLFDAQGVLIHRPTQQRLAELLAAFREWILRLSPARAVG